MRQAGIRPYDRWVLSSASTELSMLLQGIHGGMKLRDQLGVDAVLHHKTL